MDVTGGTEQDVEGRLGKARSTIKAMDKLWKSKIIGRATTIKIFNSNVKQLSSMLQSHAENIRQATSFCE